MRKRILAALLLVGAAMGPASAQPAQPSDNARGGIPTETQGRAARDSGYNPLWDLIGLAGLMGLLGLWRPSDNDGYTDDPV
jgi:hypothetical protein